MSRDVDYIIGPPLVIRRGDGSSYTVPSVGLGTYDPLGHARREYLAGRIDVEEFERRAGDALEHEEFAKALEHDETEGVRR
jgi:hypothetical protein